MSPCKRRAPELSNSFLNGCEEPALAWMWSARFVLAPRLTLGSLVLHGPKTIGAKGPADFEPITCHWGLFLMG